jgi:hypothetical protein
MTFLKVSIIAHGLTSGFGQARRGGVSMEKNVLVKFAYSFVLHEEIVLHDGNGMIDMVVFNEFQKPNVTKGKKYGALDDVHAFETKSRKPCVLVVMKPSYVQRKFSLVNVSIELNLTAPQFIIWICNVKPFDCRNINSWNLLNFMFLLSNGMVNKCWLVILEIMF